MRVDEQHANQPAASDKPLEHPMMMTMTMMMMTAQ
jgi:hypothetical protein